MSLFFGIPVSNRQVSKEFALVNENYRKADRIHDFGMRISQAVQTFYFWGFMSLVSFMISSAYQESIFPLSATKMIPLHHIHLLEDVHIQLSFVSKTELDDAVVKKHKLIRKNPGGKYTHGYIYPGTILMSGVGAIVTEIGRDNLHMANGVSGHGLYPTAVLSLLTLSRLCRGFLHSQVAGSPINVDASSSTTEAIFTQVRVKVSGSSTTRGIVQSSDDEEIDVPSNIAKLYGITASTTPVDAIFVPKHASADVIYDPETVPEVAGHCFRYVPNVIPGDRDYFADFLYSRFALSFSNDPAKSKASIQTIVDCLPAISRSGPGQVVLHVLLCISFAIASGGKLVLVMDGPTRFLGAIVQTPNVLWVGSNHVVPVDADSIRSTVSTWMTTTKARGVVAAELAKLKSRTTGKASKVDESDIDTLQKLFEVIAARQSMKSVPEAMASCLPYLGYTTKYLPADAEHITKVLTNIASSAYPSSCAMTESLFTHDDLYVSSNLSAFGYTSVSFVNPGGKKVELYAEKSEDPMLGKEKEITKQVLKVGKKGKRTYVEVKEKVAEWDRITVSRVEIDIAIRDFETVRSTKYIYQTPSYDNKILGNVDVHPLHKDDLSLLDALRNFGGSAEDFVVTKKKKEFVSAADVGESDDEEEGEAGMEF